MTTTIRQLVKGPAIAIHEDDAVKIVLVQALSLFIGLEREEHKQREPGYAFGGIRTFPFIGDPCNRLGTRGYGLVRRGR